ncbi:DNA repair protein RecO [Alicyclobacillus sp. ALC3]|uniref:DNA repair protein RecO n=1 Tax=Alicyclobacillus sp. ALC3 TaxID=2796143 RepID=UPI0023786026|nr:DNA repair protein RecO [Alicyclobacillus sp. ALC3]WDL96346.1 DNA repair protein RecO [Alicyclobacillus sp. ALC3]
MNYNTEAVVVRATAYGETHTIVNLLTPSGIVAAMARGAKKPQSRLSAGVQLCVRGMYALYQNRGMGQLNQVEVLDARRTLREDLERAAYAAYFCELVGAVAEERPHGSSAVYTQFNGALDRLTRGSGYGQSDATGYGTAPAIVARIWEAKVLRMLGASPTWTRCARCGAELVQGGWYSPEEGGCVCGSCKTADDAAGSRRQGIALQRALPRVLESFSVIPWERLGDVRLTAQSVRTLDNVLRTQMFDYAGLSLKSREILQSLTEWEN